MTESEYWELRAEQAKTQHALTIKATASWLSYWNQARINANTAHAAHMGGEAGRRAVALKNNCVRLAESLADFGAKHHGKSWEGILAAEEDNDDE